MDQIMKKLIFLLLAVMLLTACGQNKEAAYVNITAEEAKQIMDTEEGYIILDTRTQGEYDEGHIPGAIVISHDEIEEKAEGMLPDKDQLILVYCRSGRRSKLAAETLVELGYTNIKEFGGIIDWPYEVEK
jgi:rhodanese-related sulfurtransferase